MITHKDYEKAKQVIADYEKQLTAPCCTCNIKEGCYVRYNEKARENLGSCYHTSRMKVKRVYENKECGTLVETENGITNIYWLQHA